MPSQLKSETARINGAKSRGPKSPETRQKSSQNSLKHGLTATSTITMDCESPEEFKKFLAEYVAVHQPANAAEQDLLDQMVAARWRIRRSWTMETGMMDCEMASRKAETLKQFPNADTAVHMALAFRSLADGSRSLALISRYESRLQRTYERAYKTLRELQQARMVGQASRPVNDQADTLPSTQDSPTPASEPPANSVTTKPPSARVIEIKNNRTNPSVGVEHARPADARPAEHTPQEPTDAH